jgi:divalent metal cation (Fe/Co/Zn/Cd) transporter
MSEHKMKPIWYFVGLILLVMGILIICSGIYQLISPPETKTVLADTHPSLWWGGIMAIFGAVMFGLSGKKSG